MERRDTAHVLTGSELGPICQDCSKEGFGEDRPRTLYVHLNSGEVAAVEDVTGLKLTGKSIIVQRKNVAPVIYPRAHVYYACCENDRPPSFD